MACFEILYISDVILPRILNRKFVVDKQKHNVKTYIHIYTFNDL